MNAGAVKWIGLALCLSSCLSLADTDYCFESDKQDIAARTLWSHHHFVLRGEDPQHGPRGRIFMGLRGVGWNDAPTPNGGTDTVPLIGAATKDVDGTWLVSLQGTLQQQSLLEAGDHAGRPTYWVITVAWTLDSAAAGGVGHYGNVSTLFNNQFAHVADDSVDIVVYRVSCDDE